MTTDHAIPSATPSDRHPAPDRTGTDARRRLERDDAITALGVRLGSGLLVVAALAAAFGGWIATLT